MQWKFPLVTELIDAVLTVEKLSLDSNSGASLSYELFKYGRDETLVLYNVADKNRMELLKPYHTTQV